jgi:uncharacterized protein (TIGR01777 family)
MRVVVTGATGFVGKSLVAALLASGAEVTALSRDRARAAAVLPGADIVEATTLEEAGAWTAALAGADVVVHLAGEMIGGKRWDARQKQIIRDSRIESTARIVEAIGALAPEARPRALISASGVDYYPFTLRSRTSSFDDYDDDITEADPAGDSFLARVCRDWEAEALAAEALGVRVVVMRTGLVLGPGGGVLAKMSTPFKFFVGGKVGSGEQWFSWIHLEDVVAAYLAAITHDRYRGPINLVAPHAILQRDFAKALGAAMHRPSLFGVPAFAVKAAVGEMAQYLLEGRKVVPAALTRLGFAFTRPRIEDALRER